ncbi:MAG: hypothetical protein NT175_03825 [Bacteroidetes bacterium]|nr:hypothetical protein [Bacteroidota bacterium]
MKNFLKISVVAVSLIIIARYTIAQECEAYFPMKEGSYLEMKNYDEKNKLTGTVKNTVIKKEVQGNTITVTVDVKCFDEKDKESFTNQVQMYCKDGVFYMDMKNFLDKQSMESMKDMQVTVESDNMEIPSNMQPGQTLKDAFITFTMQMGSMKMVAFSVKIMNRKVEAVEDITVPAGTFTCYKLSQDMETKSGIKMTSSSVSWYAKDVGVVRSETFDKKGKMMGYSVLTDYKY